MILYKRPWVFNCVSSCMYTQELVKPSLAPKPPQAFNHGFGFKKRARPGRFCSVIATSGRHGRHFQKFLPNMAVRDDLTVFYRAMLEGSTFPSQYTALQLTLQIVGSRLLDTEATRLTCTRGRSQHTFFDG